MSSFSADFACKCGYQDWAHARPGFATLQSDTVQVQTRSPVRQVRAGRSWGTPRARGAGSARSEPPRPPAGRPSSLAPGRRPAGTHSIRAPGRGSGGTRRHTLPPAASRTDSPAPQRGAGPGRAGPRRTGLQAPGSGLPPRTPSLPGTA